MIQFYVVDESNVFFERNNEMIKANFHMHTPRCGHAQGSEREYIESAIKNGYKVIGFSDHTPQPYPDGIVSGMRMGMDELDNYIGVIKELSKEYEKDIKIYIGLEVEYYPNCWNKLLVELRKRDIDYIIMGQHHVKEEFGGFYSGAPTDDIQKVKDYVDVVIEGLKTGEFIYLAHPDLINYTGPDDLYINEMTRLCRFTKENDIPLEVNMLGFETNRNYPCDRFFKLASDMGNTFVIGCDAHSPEWMVQPEDVPGLMEFMDRNNIVLEQDIIEKRIVASVL